MSYKPSAKFHDAVTYLSSGAGPSNVSTSTKLELYGLFKLLTVSPSPTTSRPGIWDITGRPKWDAWNAAGKAYTGRAADAEQKYLAIARELGWKEGAGESIAAETSQSAPPEQKGEDIWDDESTTKRTGTMSGWGNKVSTVTVEDGGERQDDTLHSFSVSGDEERIKVLLREHPGINVNAIDEYGYTPLHLACDRGHKRVVELLLAEGADASIKDQDDFTALELARIAEHEDIVAVLEKS